MHTEGEIAGARAAAAAGIPFSLSTLGTASIEDVATAIPQGRRWFQLYMWRDRDRSMALVRRAIEILSVQLTRAMLLLGVTCPEELSLKHVTQLRRLGPLSTA